MKEYFKVEVSRYATEKSFSIYRPASLENPKDNAVMFVTGKYVDNAAQLLKCSNCLVFWPDGIDVPNAIEERHVVLRSENPRKSYCMFFRDNNITYYPASEKYNIVNDAYVSEQAAIGENCQIMPGAYIAGGVVIGNDCYIGTGVRIVGEVQIGNHVVIRENTVIGADGLSTNRDEEGKAITMPQFGGVIIEDDVQIGALVVIGRGAIDNTIIKRGAKIDNSTFISHNVIVGEDTFIVGETIMFGSSSTGERAFISGNATIRDGKHIGTEAKVGMGAVVVKDVEDGAVVKGNPAR
ncbi:MAG: UDP-3-O-(3-hydroxymyristoyl)glucosamine N-acyltransferase [Eubacteriales bacterium]|nr:UDP-3-O-(3-hydroxymyristoyl)glucosamine N-acyltransferase [Eubacteriales bacterium]